MRLLLASLFVCVLSSVVAASPWSTWWLQIVIGTALVGLLAFGAGS